MSRRVHQFSNGVKVYDDHLLDLQRDRYRQWNVHEAEEEDIFTAALLAIPPGGVYVNVGSAIGYYPILARSLRQDLSVHMFEPLAHHRRCAVENIALNEMSVDGFSIHEEALSEEAGAVQLVEKDYSSFVAADGVSSIEGCDVSAANAITLSDLVAMVGGCVHLCQMDIQGHELCVFRASGEVLESQSVITFLVGTHRRGAHREIASLLQGAGYQLIVDNFDTKAQPDGILMATLPQYGRLDVSLGLRG